MKIYLHIERLVLEGVPADQPRLLRQALEQELTGRLTEGGLAPELRRGGAVPHVRGGSIDLSQKSHSANLGTQIAGAVYRGIGGTK